MTASWQYSNPVKIDFGVGAADRLKQKLEGRAYCLLTYGDNPHFIELGDKISAKAGKAAVVVRDVEPNPSFIGLRKACSSYMKASSPPEVIVALGGGSVIDTAKVLAAANGDFSRVQSFLEGAAGAKLKPEVAIIAVPTTAGTGSEVTSWATVWDTEKKKKYSLALPELYPEYAVIDPSLAVGLPRDLTVSTGLDALSHALESIWNVNANPVSTHHAIFAAREVIDVLPRLVSDLTNVDHRARLARACLFAGLAFSNTKTALAHSLSYYLTLHYGTVHGIACSFSLPAVMRSVVGKNAACDQALSAIFGKDLTLGAATLEKTLTGLGVSTLATDYGPSKSEWIDAVNDALIGERGKNFIGDREAVLSAV
jgi:alcohol dehydrogenase